jgi:2-polyprenyl-6-methoxyphenol hydroxylase-like FAD-dependent oxidoreductase
VRVALVEKRPDPLAFKRICGHFIQASAVPTLERLDLLDPIMAAGGMRSRPRLRTPYGWIVAPPDPAGFGVNLRRERLDPIMREAAAGIPGVELILGCKASGLLKKEEVARGVVVQGPEGQEAELRARLVVGADGGDSAVARMAGVAKKTRPHGRFSYAAYFENALPATAPDGSAWLMDPQFAGAFPTDSGLAIYAAMPTMDRLPEFKRDPAAALVSFIAGLPDAPPIRGGHQVGSVLGKLDMTNRIHTPVAPGLALAGDAALATDPLFAVGCGWALQSAEWLADSVMPALQGAEPLSRGLTRYGRRRRRQLLGHTPFIHNYSNGRPLRSPERLTFAAAARDPRLAAAFHAYGARRIGLTRVLATAGPRLVAANVRYVAGRRQDGT